MLAAAHAEGLRMIGRFDLSKGTGIAYEAHPEWFVHNAEGEPQEYNGTYQACVNGGWASDYSLRILREGLERYDLDGVFFNMTGYQPVDYSGRHRGMCHGANCRTAFADMFGRDLPAREDFSDSAFADYLLFKRRTSKAAAQRIYDTVKSVRPGTGVMGNGRGTFDFMRLEIQREARPRHGTSLVWDETHTSSTGYGGHAATYGPLPDLFVLICYMAYPIHSNSQLMPQLWRFYLFLLHHKAP